MELVHARLRSMDAEDIAIQVVYELFSLPVNSVSLLRRRFILLTTAGWASTREQQADQMGRNRQHSTMVKLSAVRSQISGRRSVIVLGTAGDLTFDHPTLLRSLSHSLKKLPLAVRAVGWSCRLSIISHSHILSVRGDCFLVARHDGIGPL